VKRIKFWLALLLLLSLLFAAGCGDVGKEIATEIGKEILNELEKELLQDAPSVTAKPAEKPAANQPSGSAESAVPTAPAADDVIGLDNLPEFAGEPYCVLNNNEPEFTPDEITTEAYEFFSELDNLGRCGVVMSCVGKELMPTEDRESISSVTPAGWVNVPYDFVDGRYLYNRCHLIGFQLTGENANKKNLITGTRYLNVEGMLPFENMVADYVKETGNHVMYRITPIHEGNELVARGVQMEAWSVEDEGDGICFNVYTYNVQPGVLIDYATGESRLDEEYLKGLGDEEDYVLNTGSKKFHLPSCSGATGMKEANRQEYTGSRQLLISQGFEPCSQCEP